MDVDLRQPQCVLNYQVVVQLQAWGQIPESAVIIFRSNARFVRQKPAAKIEKARFCIY